VYSTKVAHFYFADKLIPKKLSPQPVSGGYGRAGVGFGKGLKGSCRYYSLSIVLGRGAFSPLLMKPTSNR
jgi:hypothetical protein